jgi:hypothetical protein
MRSHATDGPTAISAFIQKQLHARRMKSVDPVTATGWLIRRGLQKEIGTRPGSFLRSLCRRGVITGAEKHGPKWQIKKKNKTT